VPLQQPRAQMQDALTLARAVAGEVPVGALVVKGGAVEHGPRLFAQPTVHHRPEVYGGICQEEAAELFRAFLGRGDWVRCCFFELVLIRFTRRTERFLRGWFCVSPKALLIDFSMSKCASRKF
jgi:hypothetical protein